MKNPFSEIMRRVNARRKLGEEKLMYQSGLAHELELEKLSEKKRQALLKTRGQVQGMHGELAQGIIETWKSALYRGFGSTSKPAEIWEDARGLAATKRAAENNVLGLVGKKGLAMIYSSDEFHGQIAKQISDYIKAIDGTLNRQRRDPQKIEHLFSIIAAIDPKLADKVREEYAKRG